MIQGLYLVTDGNRDQNLLDKVQQALRGGARIVQYRAKHQPAPEQIEAIRSLLPLCREADVPLLVNDSVDIALESGADGVHLGQEDMSAGEARNRLGRDKILGITCRTVEQAMKAEMQGADYIGFGAIYATETKDDTQVVGIEGLEKVRKAVHIPIVAIGGLNAERGAEAIAAGANAIAVYSAVMDNPVPMQAALELSMLFNRQKPFPRGRVLTIAGSDSGGGAGIQADLKTICLLGGYGASALTALTAQNTQGVQAIEPVSADFMAAQVDAVLSDIDIDTIKTGMLYSSEVVSRLSQLLKDRPLLIVVDPVIVAKGGENLLKEEAVDSILMRLLPITYLVTPNLPEAEALTGQPVETLEQMEQAAYALQELGANNVLIKGGHLEGDAVDLLLAGDKVHTFHSERIDTPNTHGTGCSYSSAIATLLAQGQPLVKAVQMAKDFITEAIRTAPDIGVGHGPINHFQGAIKLMHGPMNHSNGQ